MLVAICIAVILVFEGCLQNRSELSEWGGTVLGYCIFICGAKCGGALFEKIFQAVGRMKTSMFCIFAWLCDQYCCLIHCTFWNWDFFLQWESQERTCNRNRTDRVTGRVSDRILLKPIPAKVKVRKYEAGEALCKSVFYRNPSQR